MDIEKLTHSGYKLSVLTAIVLSAIVVTVAAFLGRGALNLKGALILEEPTDVTVIAAVEQAQKDIGIRDIDFLRKESRSADEKPNYAYQIKTSKNEYYLVKIRFNAEKKQWSLITFELLHADPNPEEASAQ